MKHDVDQRYAPSVAHPKHERNHFAQDHEPSWWAAQAACEENGFHHRTHAWCDYCGSMHPAELTEAIQAGARVHWADRKYGWPHKLYIDDIPNPYAGQQETICSTNRREDDAMSEEERIQQKFEVPTLRVKTETISVNGVEQTRVVSRTLEYRQFRAAPEKTHGKFYTVHLKDATPEQLEVIQRAMGIRFTFDDAGGVSWSPFEEKAV